MITLAEVIEWRSSRMTCLSDAQVRRYERRVAARSLRRPQRKARGEGRCSGYARAAWMLGDPCAYCGGRADTFDHIEPQKRDGSHAEDNLARSCFSCNAEKSSRPLIRFLTIRAYRKALGTWKPRKVPRIAAEYRRGAVKPA